MAAGDLTLISAENGTLVVEAEVAAGATQWIVDLIPGPMPTLATTPGVLEPIPTPPQATLVDVPEGDGSVAISQYDDTPTELASGLLVYTMPPALPDTPFDQIMPSVQEVADLVRTRLVSEGGYNQDTFTEDTYPTDAQAQRLIDQAANAIYVQLPGSVAEPWAPAGRHLAALYAAILIEASYFREQLTDDQVALYRDLLTSGIRGLGASISGGEVGPAHMSVDVVLQRSVMTKDDPYLPPPMTTVYPSG